MNHSNEEVLIMFCRSQRLILLTRVFISLFALHYPLLAIVQIHLCQCPETDLQKIRSVHLINILYISQLSSICFLSFLATRTYLQTRFNYYYFFLKESLYIYSMKIKGGKCEVDVDSCRRKDATCFMQRKNYLQSIKIT